MKRSRRFTTSSSTNCWNGALGTHLAEGLVRAGVKQLTIVDRDYIEYSNLQRQTLFTEQDAAEGLPKVIAAKAHLKVLIKMYKYMLL